MVTEIFDVEVQKWKNNCKVLCKTVDPYKCVFHDNKHIFSWITVQHLEAYAKSNSKNYTRL